MDSEFTHCEEQCVNSESTDEEFVVNVPAVSWADDVEDVDGLTKDEPEPRRWRALPRETRTCWTCGLLRDEQESLSQWRYCCVGRPQRHVSCSLWTDPLLCQLRTRNSYPPARANDGQKLASHVPDLVSELTASWSKILSTCVTVDLDGAEEVAYLPPSHNHGDGCPTTLPFTHCSFSTSQLDKIYRAQALLLRHSAPDVPGDVPGGARAAGSCRQPTGTSP